ncbi:glycosyltransferase family 2 protein [Rhodovulum steppense]|uniref:Glycosyl transferase family 2 n=1 Tax=Rhodovulum steppense TaxID=540251 RepID=A0A4R1YN28_9RHOB|nr:glycosyltransferase family A protein [Rhodovulum steppense]TCM78957.1 glycosyl transferase family 2 [Rhodovulum steppense]
MAPSVSVVVPAFNAEKYLEETVHSALGQSVPPIEIIIVNDGSSDGTAKVADQLAATHPEVTATHRPNGGAAAARNTGLSRARGEFILFLDADDRLTEDAIRHHLEVFEQHPDAAMVFGSNNVIDETGTFLGTNPVPQENVTIAELAMRVTPSQSQCLYRKSALEAIGGYDEAIRYSQDIEANLRLIQVGGIHSHDRVVMDYRRHQAQSTRKSGRIFPPWHIIVLEKHFGPAGLTPDPDLLRKAKARWYSKYGYRQHRVALGALRRGRFSEAIVASKFAFMRLKARFQGENWRPGSPRGN